MCSPSHPCNDRRCSILTARPLSSRVTWGLDTSSTINMYSEMGVLPLVAADDDNINNDNDAIEGDNTGSLITPMIEIKDSMNQPLLPPAPRILVASQRDNCFLGKTVVITKLTPGKSDYQLFKRRTLVQESSAPDPFLNLSDEVILHVFRFLPRFVLCTCAQVCRRWSSLVNDESLWRRVDLGGRVIQAKHVSSLVNRGTSRLRLNGTEILGTRLEGLRPMFTTQKICKLQYLDLSMAMVEPDLLVQLFSLCKELRKLSLENLQLNNAVFNMLGENEDLEELNLCMCHGITTDGLRAIFSNCKCLEALNVAWTAMSQSTINYLSLCLPANILKLNLSGCRENITDKDVVELCRACPDLMELDLSDATLLTCHAVLHISKHLQQLEHLALSRCYHISPRTLSCLASLPRLQAVDCFGMLGDNPLQELKEKLQGVQVNSFPFSSIARPTTGLRRTSIWGQRVRESVN
ncbi:S-phase kinase-associated protein 2-like isoform X2 [Pomacea canaliculata]|uniref:S-phase kinase-associated protein 2-like isoform X2 n=1 Tax=Pomacea canaliculata TaxID=400727 RepID=UPI000D73EB9D|nr:S-phase kinase-associated protein 2-like isoform X2 [Pomacea canaliculata]